MKTIGKYLSLLALTFIVGCNAEDIKIKRSISGLCLRLDLKMYLSNRYQNGTGLMTTTLNSGYLLPGLDHTTNPSGPLTAGVAAPAGQPFNISPWFYNGTEGLDLNDQGGTIPNPYPTDTVDWILISLRKNSIQKADEVMQEAYLLKSNGNLNKVSDQCFEPDSGDDQYYVVIEHFNYLRTMSHALVPIKIKGNDLYLSYDFTIRDSYKESNNGQFQNADGKYSIFASDLDQDGDVDMDDYNNVFVPNFNVTGNYQSLGDFDGDGSVTAVDLATLANVFGIISDVPN